MEAVRDGNVAVIRAMSDSKRADKTTRPLQRMLKAATQGSSVGMLEYVLQEGARVTSEIDIIDVIPRRRHIRFFQVLVAHGWPAGPRGLANNLRLGPEVVRLLLDNGAQVDIPCLKEATRAGDVAVVDLLMSRINLRAKVPSLHDYLKAIDDPGYWRAPEMCSEERSLKRIIDQAGLLHIAAYLQDLDMVKYLLGKGADLDLIPDNAQAVEGVNGCALHRVVSGMVAGKSPSLEVVKVLLDAGANPAIQDELGRTPLEINEAWGGGTKEEIRKLFEAKLKRR